MATPRARRRRDTCEPCGTPFYGEWFAVHQDRRVLRCCEDCLMDWLSRRAVQSRETLSYLDALWLLEPKQLGGFIDDGGVGVL